jgi:hypothetical protein
VLHKVFSKKIRGKNKNLKQTLILFLPWQTPNCMHYSSILFALISLYSANLPDSCPTKIQLFRGKSIVKGKIGKVNNAIRLGQRPMTLTQNLPGILKVKALCK